MWLCFRTFENSVIEIGDLTQIPMLHNLFYLPLLLTFVNNLGSVINFEPFGKKMDNCHWGRLPIERSKTLFFDDYIPVGVRANKIISEV